MKCLFTLGTTKPEPAEGIFDAHFSPLTSHLLPPLRSFGDYELLEEIARGGMGIIYRARQKSLGRIVAVKMLLFGDQSGKEQARRFRAEAALAASLQHPNIVTIHEVSAHESQPFFVMDFIEGQSLAKLNTECAVRNAEWLRRAARYVKTVAEAIHYAHERGILHRDLKPSNVLIDPFDQPRVTDFGLAKNLHHDSELTLSGQVLGSPNYMPPEQAAAKRGLVGRRSDVYSLGAILYHLLTGRPPFVGETLTDTLHSVLNTEPVSPRLLNPSVPPDLETLCLKCLEKEPARRYQTAQSLVEDLNRFLRDEPIHARPTGRLEKLWRWSRRKPVVASLSAATVVLLFTVAVGSPVAVYLINEERMRAEDAVRKEAVLRLQAESRGDLAKAQLLCQEFRFSEAEKLMKRIPAPALQAERRDAAIVFSDLMDSFARHGRWTEALPHAISAVEFEPTSADNYVSLLSLLVAAKDWENYRRYSGQFLDRVGHLNNALDGEKIAKGCLFVPSPEMDLVLIDKLAGEALVAAKSLNFLPYYQFAKGLVEYRRGQFASGSEWMRKSIANPVYGDGWMRYVQSYMVLAMAQHQLKEFDEARDAFAKGIKIEQTKVAKLESGDLGPGWYWRDWIIAHALMDEAKALMEDPPSTTNESTQK